MQRLKEIIKAALIKAQKEGKIPADFANLNTSIFDESLQPLSKIIGALYDDFGKILAEELDRSFDLFKDMQDNLEEWL